MSSTSENDKLFAVCEALAKDAQNECELITQAFEESEDEVEEQVFIKINVKMLIFRSHEQ